MKTTAPFLLEPWFSPRPWGAESLRPWFPVDSPGDPIGEAWLTGNDSRILSGVYDGKTLGELMRENPEAVLGDGARQGADYPLLIKLIFPHDKLSVQVHPDDATAHRMGLPRGKTECWYVLDAEPGACVQVGLRDRATHETIRAAIADGTVEQWLETIRVQRGDMVFVDAGTVHAIGPGVVLLETQQQSDVTFRMYDYGRPRPLHVDESLAALKLATHAGKVTPRSIASGGTERIANDFFRITEYELAAGDSMTLPSLPSPRTVFLRSGDAKIHDLGLKLNHVAIVPAQCSTGTIESDTGARVLEMVPGTLA